MTSTSMSPVSSARAAVGAVGAHDGRGHSHFQRAGRVDLVDRVRGLDEDPVRVGRGAEVDLDAPLQARDAAEQERVVGELRARRQQRPCPAGLPARPGVAGCGERQRGCCAVRVVNAAARS